MSFGQPPICDSDCVNCQKEPGVRPSRGENPPVPPKPASLKVQPQGAFGGPDYNRELGEPLKVKKVPPPVAPKPNRFRQPSPQPGNILPPSPSQTLTPRRGAQPQPAPVSPDVLRAPYSPHTPPYEDDQYTEYMRSRAPSQGDGEMSFREPRTVSPGLRSSPRTPSPENEQYAEYMRSRAPSQGYGEMSFREPRPVPPTNRNRLYGLIDSREQSPWPGLNTKYNLTLRDFDEVMKSSEKAFVMFHDPNSESSTCAGQEFKKAMERDYPYNYVFATVDCTQEQQLCSREDATRLPMFKVYSNGFELSTIRDVKKFCANQIEMLMRKTPVLTQPRTNVAPGLKRS